MIDFDFILKHLDYLAAMFLLVGYFRMRSKEIDSWIYTGLGSSIYVFFGIWIISAVGLAASNMFFVILSINGFCKWRNNPQ